VSADARRHFGGLAVEPHLTGFKECSKVGTVARDGFAEDRRQRRGVKVVFASSRHFVRGTKEN
jgi:hypothetical protein